MVGPGDGERGPARRVQLAIPAAADAPGALPGRIIGGRELLTSPLTTDSTAHRMLTRGPDSSCHDSNESPRQAGTRDRTADQAPAAFQQICSIPSYASAFKQPPTNSILGGASIAKDRRK